MSLCVLLWGQAVSYTHLDVYKRQVPRDVKFVAYDGTFITELSEPRMTAVVQPLEGLARESVRLLTDLINGKEYHDEAVLLGVELRRGKTTLP